MSLPEKHHMYFEDISREVTTEEEAILLERIQFLTQFSDNLAQRLYNTSYSQLRREALCEGVGKGTKLATGYYEIMCITKSIIGSPMNYIDETMLRRSRGLPSRFEEWQKTQYQLEEKV